MIDIGKILKRAWHILWNYKVLWIFGILLALVAGGGGRASSGSNYQFSSNDWNNFNPNYQPGPQMQEFFDWLEQYIIPLFDNPEQHITTWLWIGVAFFLFLLILGVIFAFIRYPSEAAILRMVDDYEQTGTKVGFKQGWKLGWSRRAFRMWGINFLVIVIPSLIYVSLAIGGGILVLINLIKWSVFVSFFAFILGFLAFTFLYAIMMAFLGLLRQFFVRATCLDDLGTRGAFRQGWLTFKQNWKSATLMWLVMLGIGIGVIITEMILAVFLIPVYIVLLVPAAIVAFIPGLIAFGIASLFTGTILAAIIGGIIALPFFVTVLSAPLILYRGGYMIFDSSVWTLTYREMKVLEGLQPTTDVEVSAETA
jgi:hypothetical protein